MTSRSFIHDDFLLETAQARRLYHEFAEHQAIIDYHCHLPVRHIAEDRRWDNIAQLWLEGDHYKWRAMRANAAPERCITGDAPDREKFDAFAAAMPYLLRNPIYHWVHLQLARYFDITDKLLGPETADEIWNRCNEQIAQPEFSCRSLMKRSNVVLTCTTDDPTDSLTCHQAIAADDTFDIQVLPAWRPSGAMAADNSVAFNIWTDKLADVAEADINDFDSFIAALRKRHEFFHSMGCRLSDHTLQRLCSEDCTHQQIRDIFARLRSGGELDDADVAKFKSVMLYEFGLMDHQAGWTQQYHIGAIRNNSTRIFETCGPDAGCDSIGDCEIARPLSRLLDRLDSSNRLPKTILYNINPRDNELMAAMAGAFQDGSIAGKIQFGSGWWFLDQKDGMQRQIEALSQVGLLRRFVGMLTDSRSVLSYVRHEYFRRILCNVLGSDMAAGLLPDDMELIGAMVADICYNNAAEYFGFDVEPPRRLKRPAKIL